MNFTQNNHNAGDVVNYPNRMTLKELDWVIKHGGSGFVIPPDFPEIVCLCGSTRFKDAFESEMARLTNEGKIVLTVGRFGHLDGLDMDGDLKKRLDELHLRKIDLCDRVHVINQRTDVCDRCSKRCYAEFIISDCCRATISNVPYIGESTRREINYAKAKGKKITYMNEPA